MIHSFHRLLLLLLIITVHLSVGAAQNNESLSQEEEDLRQLFDNRQIALIEQVGQRNALHIQQIGGSANKAEVYQNGRENSAAVSLLGGVNNESFLHQYGNYNSSEIVLKDGTDNTIYTRQKNNFNRLEIDLERAEDVHLRIQQNGQGYISLDIPDYRSYSRTNLDLSRATINQSKGGVPIIISPGRSSNFTIRNSGGGN